MPRALDPNRVYPDKDRYYVYGLFKPNGVPFYIGKGKNSRINDHFNESNLKVNSPKVGLIKKYRNSVKREVLCYFDKEESAYEFEEYLIAYYGLASEGGLLANYAKTRFEYSDQFVMDVCNKGHEDRDYKYTKAQILSFYDLYFKKDMALFDIEDILNIPVNYQYYLRNGSKWSHLYKDYTESPSFENLRSEVVKSNPKRHKISDVILTDSFNKVCSGLETIHDLAKNLGVNEVWLGKVFLGVKRSYLKLDTEKYKSMTAKGQSVLSKNLRLVVAQLLDEGVEYKEIMSQLSMGKTTFYRHLRSINQEAVNGS